MKPSLDEQLIAAYTSFRAKSGATADSILVDPAPRNQFLDLVPREAGNELGEGPVLRKLLNLRKRSRLTHPLRD
jgi:hypothetical protein